jgi:hypothetical protein
MNHLAVSARGIDVFLRSERCDMRTDRSLETRYGKNRGGDLTRQE